MTTPDRRLSRDAIERMVRVIDPAWSVREDDPASGGFNPVYRLLVETPTGTRRCVLKATPDDAQPANDTEARLLCVLRDHTSIPVPEVVGAVDVHDDLPAPFFLMDAMPGAEIPRTEIDTLSGGTIERIARSVGEHLADLHRLDAVDAFGTATHDAPRPLRGGRPRGDVDRIVVADAEASWPACVRRWGREALRDLSSTRFADLVPRLRPALDERADHLSGPFRPALSHIDGSLDNLLVDPETEEVTAVLDWGFTLAAAPAYDLVYVVHGLNGGPWSMVPSAPDHRSLIRRALLDGYGEEGPGNVVARFHEHRDLYGLLNLVHSMIHAEDRLGLDGATGSQIEGAARRHRERAERLL